MDEVALTFYLPETDFSMLDVDLALAGLRPLLPPRRPSGDSNGMELSFICAYEVLQRIWHRYCETVVPEEPTWPGRYPPLHIIWGETKA